MQYAIHPLLQRRGRRLVHKQGGGSRHDGTPWRGQESGLGGEERRSGLASTDVVENRRGTECAGAV